MQYCFKEKRPEHQAPYHARWEYRYDPPFKFNGKIDKLTFKLEPNKEPAKP